MGRSVIVGAGTVGTLLAARLAARGDEVILVSRSGSAPSIEGVLGVALDATNTGALAAVATGAAAIYNCANPPYHRWARDWPPLAASILSAAEQSGAVLVTLSNLYGYGPVDHAMAEDDPLAARSTKGRVRAAMWDAALAAHRGGRVRVTEVRASDYFGPTVRLTGMLGERVVPRVLDHSTVSLLGDLDAPRSWTYVEDIASALEIVAGDERAWGRAWHAPTAAPLSSREAVAGLARAAGLAVPRVRRVPWALVRAAGALSPQLRELHEVAYQFDRPFVMDSSAFASTFHRCPTPLEECFAATIGWWRAQRGFPLPSLAATR